MVGNEDIPSKINRTKKFYEYRKPREKTKNNLIPEVCVEKGHREDGRAGCVG